MAIQTHSQRREEQMSYLTGIFFSGNGNHGVLNPNSIPEYNPVSQSQNSQSKPRARVLTPVKWGENSSVVLKGHRPSQKKEVRSVPLASPTENTTKPETSWLDKAKTPPTPKAVIEQPPTVEAESTNEATSELKVEIEIPSQESVTEIKSKPVTTKTQKKTKWIRIL